MTDMRNGMDMMDFFEGKDLLESATPENPVKLRLSDGAGQHIDILVSEATVTVKPSKDDGLVMDLEEGEPIKIEFSYKKEEEDDTTDKS